MVFVRFRNIWEEDGRTMGGMMHQESKTVWIKGVYVLARVVLFACLRLKKLGREEGKRIRRGEVDGDVKKERVSLCLETNVLVECEKRGR